MSASEPAYYRSFGGNENPDDGFISSKPKKLKCLPSPKTWSKNEIGMLIGTIAALALIALITVAILSQKGIIPGAPENFMNKQFIPFFHNAGKITISGWSVIAVGGGLVGIALLGVGAYKFKKNRNKKYLNGLIRELNN